MTHRISRISVHQTSKVLAIVYGILGFVVVPILWLAWIGDPEIALPFWIALLFPLLYALLGYVFTAIGTAIYNLVAKSVGGIEFTVVMQSD